MLKLPCIVLLNCNYQIDMGKGESSSVHPKRLCRAPATTSHHHESAVPRPAGPAGSPGPGPIQQV